MCYKKFFVKISAVVLVFSLALCYSSSAFATSSFNARSLGMHCVLNSLGEASGHLNLEGSETIASDNRNVSVYSRTSSADQLWYPATCSSGAGEKFFSGQTTTDGYRRALNINNSTKNCNIYRDVPSNDVDSLISIIRYSGDDFRNIGIDLTQHPTSRSLALGSGRNIIWKDTGVTPSVWTRCA